MNIISNYTKDTRTEKPIPGSYEWWYFDAQSVDGYRIVVIFYDGNPFSRRYIQNLESEMKITAEKFPAISISVYKNDRPIFYSFEEVEPNKAYYSSEIPFGRIGNNKFSGNHHQTRMEYILDLNHEIANGDFINAKLSFRTDFDSLPHLLQSNTNDESHEWNLIMPSASVKGDIRIGGYHESEIVFTGLGYHDHNSGVKPLKDSFHEWYWGRYHLEDCTFIYYLMNCNDKWENSAWLIDRKGKTIECENIEVSNFGYSFWGLKTARVIECTVNGTDIFIQLDELLDNGPFYQRFGGRLISKGNEIVDEARGISEYIRPSRIYDRKFWPFVNMRISYPGKPHWVHKNPRLYRWTW